MRSPPTRDFKVILISKLHCYVMENVTVWLMQRPSQMNLKEIHRKKIQKGLWYMTVCLIKSQNHTNVVPMFRNILNGEVFQLHKNVENAV